MVVSMVRNARFAAARALARGRSPAASCIRPARARAAMKAHTAASSTGARRSASNCWKVCAASSTLRSCECACSKAGSELGLLHWHWPCQAHKSNSSAVWLQPRQALLRCCRAATHSALYHNVRSRPRKSQAADIGTDWGWQGHAWMRDVYVRVSGRRSVSRSRRHSPSTASGSPSATAALIRVLNESMSGPQPAAVMRFSTHTAPCEVHDALPVLAELQAQGQIPIDPQPGACGATSGGKQLGSSAVPCH
jgi:hypothetical protein